MKQASPACRPESVVVFQLSRVCHSFHEPRVCVIEFLNLVDFHVLKIVSLCMKLKYSHGILSCVWSVAFGPANTA